MELKTTDGKSFEVECREMSTLDLMHARRYRTELIKENQEDKDVQILLVYFYSFFKYATIGAVPTPEEFLALTAKSSQLWYDAMELVNPGVLPKPNDGEPETLTPEKVSEELEKKEVKPEQSSSDSLN